MNIGLMLQNLNALSNNSSNNHSIHDNIVLPDITILKISLRYRLSWHFDIMINDNIVILPNSNTHTHTHACIRTHASLSYTKAIGCEVW